MDLHLKGRKAIVLGGTRGIGRAIAETFAEEGADVALCARNAEQVEEAIALLRSAGTKATGAAVDIMDGVALRAWIEAAAQELGGLDILVSNAGAMAQGNDEASWEQNFRLDIMGAVHAFDAAFPHLRDAGEKNGDAAFIIISSVAAAETDNANAYGPMKAALIHLAKGYAREHAKRRIRTNVVSPGTVYFDGGIWQKIETQRPDLFKATMQRNLTGRMASVQEIANAAIFLASPASAFTTGANLVVDGTITRRVNF